MASREKNGKLSTNSFEEQMAKKVLDLCGVNVVLPVRVDNYHQLPEWVKRELTNMLAPNTVCKMPARDNKNDLIFFLGKEAQI